MALRVAILALIAACQGSRSVVVGSKNFAEQRIVGELLAQTIEAAGVPVERRLGLGDTSACDRALKSGEIDAYVEYTGTALSVILGQKPPADPAVVLPTVQAAYAPQFDWMRPLGFEDTFALIVRRADADALGLKTISDAVPHAPGWTVAVPMDFFRRPDGYQALTYAYGLTFKDARTLDGTDLYGALADRTADLVIGNATDGEISHRPLAVLADDRHFFPPYEAVPVVRHETLQRHPVLREAINSLGGALPADIIRQLNWQVEGEHQDPAAVVRAFRKGPAGQ